MCMLLERDPGMCGNDSDTTSNRTGPFLGTGTLVPKADLEIKLLGRRCSFSAYYHRVPKKPPRSCSVPHLTHYITLAENSMHGRVRIPPRMI